MQDTSREKHPLVLPLTRGLKGSTSGVVYACALDFVRHTRSALAALGQVFINQAHTHCTSRRPQMIVGRVCDVVTNRGVELKGPAI